ncbi:MAG: glycosyltransferase family 2 protein [Fibrobacter sp.]|nr:glycosyltransferase family 2 protein [Fibrobacter sp.]
MSGFVYIVLPAYNEEAAIGSLIEDLGNVCRDSNLKYEIVIIDDGSADRTREVIGTYASTLPVRLQSHSVNMNLGATIRDGLQLAATLAEADDIIITMDADGTHPPALIPEMVSKVTNCADVVIASRYRKGAKVVGVPLIRQILSIGAAMMFKIFHPVKGVRDYTCGYRAYRAEVIQTAFATLGKSFVEQAGFQCMAEILLKLSRFKLTFSEVPLILRYDLKGGVSKMKVIRTIFSSLALIIKPNKISEKVDRGRQS